MAEKPVYSDEVCDESLMTLVQSGDREAFAVLVRRHNAMFYAAAWRMCSNRDEAEEIVQDAFLKLWKNPQSWDGERGVKFTTWFYRVVTNQALDYMRKRKPVQGGEILDYLEDATPGQQEEMEAREERVALETAVQALPERQRVALNLCFYEGLSNREAADVMGVGVKALESLLMRAKAGLKEALIRQKVLDGDERIRNKERQYG
ncbi:MAG: sigma-70 family RNA polymerase sigma factor [Alphaproteobacteria bacterium]|nr:sigma-70 family RNA polymerase sigma factor [Alphaproteobacteria bacterium]